MVDHGEVPLPRDAVDGTEVRRGHGGMDGGGYAGAAGKLRALAGAASKYGLRIPQPLLASMMALGAGVLLSAVSFELAEEASESCGQDGLTATPGEHPAPSGGGHRSGSLPPHDDHWAARMAGNALAHRTQDGTRDPAMAMGAHHDELGVR
jgi:hypothetical protein